MFAGVLLAIAALAFPSDRAAAADGSFRILVLGDSLTAGYGLAAADAFPAQLQAALKADGVDVQIINAGVSGDTSAGGRARLGWALGDKPQAMIVELGANDGLRGLDPAQTEANLDAIITAAKQAGVAVLLTGMKAPPNLGAEYGSEFDALYPRLAKKHGVLFDPFFLAGVAARPELNQDDGIHPNAKGVTVIVRRMLPLVRRLAQAPAKPL
ncbi:MAG: arylesterase [Rhodospirillaceae bacterium]